MKVTKKTLNKFYYDHYTTLGTETIHKTIVRPIPICTGSLWPKHFPNYLKGYEQFYEEFFYCYRLKEEYLNCRPDYFIDITYKVYDIELTVEGKSRIEALHSKYQRLADKYSKLLQKA